MRYWLPMHSNLITGMLSPDTVKHSAVNHRLGILRFRAPQLSSDFISLKKSCELTKVGHVLNRWSSSTIHANRCGYFTHQLPLELDRLHVSESCEVCGRTSGDHRSACDARTRMEVHSRSLDQVHCDHENHGGR